MTNKRLIQNISYFLLFPDFEIKNIALLFFFPKMVKFFNKKLKPHIVRKSEKEEKILI